MDFTWSSLAAMAKRQRDKVYNSRCWKEESIQVSQRRQSFLRDDSFSYFYYYSRADDLILIIQFAYFFPLFFL